MAEGIVSDLTTKALEALGKAALKQAVSWLGARDDLMKLEDTIGLIQARVRDAENRQEADGSEAIKEWLRRLKLVLYKADDLFDEVLIRDRQKQQIESRMLGKVGLLFSTSSPLYHTPKLARHIKSIRKELDAIKSDMSGLNLRDLPAQQLPIARLIEKRETASFVNIQDVIGRDNDQKNIMKILFDPKYDDEVTIIPIVGFGGLGKTTLAQLVFNHERVNNHFDLTKWAYVPEVDNLNLIMLKLFNSFKEENHDKLPLEQIKKGIRESINNNKYLLVLDDIWDEGGDRLIDLMSLLKCGKQGSKVIVTTRSDVVARLVGTIDSPYELGTLTKAQSWELFKLVAFKQGMEDKNPNFTKIGEEIVNMCGNVPLAIKVVGGFLRSKGSETEWLQARDAQRSKAQLTKAEDIMDVLKLSYDYLPPALKQCVAYCSLFPKGCRFDREELVYMWMAQGYCEPCNNEIDGDTLYMNMMARGFFQDPKFSYDGNVKNCRMHDLLHDLTQRVAGEESMVLHDDEPSIKVTHGLLHLNFTGYESTTEAHSSLFVARRMRSLILTDFYGHNKDLKDLISRLQHLRVLKVEKFVDKKFPDDIGGLMHLRYLCIQSDTIEYLPDSITRLENLQTLDLQHCTWLKELPSDFAKLTNINHLLLPNMFPSDLPGGFTKLTSLQVLNKFIVGENNGIDSLPVLNNRGRLTIEFNKWRPNCIVEAQRANLKNCYELTILELGFSRMGTFPIEEMNEMLMNLELPPNLRHLEVRHYPGEKMPSRWFDGLSKVVSMGGENLEMEEEEEETKEVAGNNTRMRHREWQGLTSLRELTLSNIPKIKKLPSGITSLTTLEMLKIHHLNNLIKLPEEFGNLSMLRELRIWDCPKLNSFPTSLQGLTSLKRLMIIACPELKSLPTSLLSLTSLKRLHISGCPHLEERYKMPDGEDCHLIQHIPGVNIR